MAVTTLAPAGQAGPTATVAGSGSRPGGVQLAAWTVARQANGDIDVTINQLRDPAGLQATLRADGLAVSVSFSGAPLSASCRPDAVARPRLTGIARFHRDGITIDPAALPSGTGLAILDEPGAGFPPNPSGATAPPGAPSLHPRIGSLLHGVDGPLAVGLVYASPQCTG